MTQLYEKIFNGKRVMITGGLGFIGSNLARRLVELNAHVLLVDSLIPEYGGNLFNVSEIKDKVHINIADVRDEHSMLHLVQDQDFLFNLAGQTSHLDSMTDPYTDLDINARSQLFILEACRKNNASVKIVFASTRQIYGVPNYLPVDEKHSLHPIDLNGVNKMAGEWYHILYNKVYGIKTCVLRLTNTYGPMMRIKDARQTFLGWWIRQILEGKEIQVYGDGLQLRDLNYVDDVVDALLMTASTEEASGGVFNLGSSEYISLKDLARCITEIHGSGAYCTVPFPPERKAIDIGDYYSDYQKIHNLLGWEPKVGLREGLRRTLTYFQGHLGHYL